MKRRYGWIAPLMRLLELHYGPFWKPSRPQPIASSRDVLAAAAELESLLDQLAASRRTALISAWVCMGMAATTFILGFTGPELVRGFCMGATVVFIAPVGFAMRLGWGGWGGPAAYVIPPLGPAPTSLQVVEALRTLCDRLFGAGDLAVEALRAMRDCSPLAYQVAVRLTVAPDRVQRAARAA